MAWQTPPTFSNGDYLTASNLNILADDIEYLYGLARQVNTGFYAPELATDSGGYDTTSAWACKHYSNTFRYYIEVTNGVIDELLIYVNGNTSNSVFEDTSDRSDGYVYSGTVSISGLSLTANAFYTIHVRIRGNNAGADNDKVRVYYLGEDF